MSYLTLAARITVCVIGIFGLTQVAAQEGVERTRPAQGSTRVESRRPSTQPEYVIEVGKADGCGFAPIRPGPNAGLFQYTLSRPSNFLPDSAGQPIVSVVNFQARQAGDFWNVEVVLSVGEFYDAGAKPVAKFTLRTNERVEVPELANFGISPMRVGVARIIGLSSTKPDVINKTESISLETLENRQLPGPYLLSLKNNSDKDVLAIQYNIYKDHKFLSLKWMGSPLPEPLIKTGAVYRLEVPSEDNTCGDPDGYRAGQSNRIDIVSVIFSDGSYEGEPALAALIRGKAFGNKDQLIKIMSVLDNANGGGEPDAAVIISNLKELAETVREAADPNMLEALQNGLPPSGADPNVLAGFIRSGQHDVKTSLISDARQLEMMLRSQGNSSVSSSQVNTRHIHEWWTATYAKYKQWLTMADAVTTH